MEILLNDETVVEEWTVALIVGKVNRGSNVKLNVSEYPINIPFEEYYVYCVRDLPTSSSCWKNLNHNCGSPDYIRGGKLSVINSNEDLGTYLICPEDYPVIDFSKHTLLLASGCTPSGGSKIRDIVFLQNSSDQYTLAVTIRTGITNDGGYYCIAILVPKIVDEEIVILDVDCR
jgi:hypothetical protein